MVKAKRLKGLTLVEIIIALAVLTILSALMVQICVAVNNLYRRTYAMNKEISYQAPIAENLNGDNSSTSSVFVLDITPGAAAAVPVSMNMYEANQLDTDANSAAAFKFFRTSGMWRGYRPWEMRHVTPGSQAPAGPELNLPGDLEPGATHGLTLQSVSFDSGIHWVINVPVAADLAGLLVFEYTTNRGQRTAEIYIDNAPSVLSTPSIVRHVVAEPPAGMTLPANQIYVGAFSGGGATTVLNSFRLVEFRYDLERNEIIGIDRDD